MKELTLNEWTERWWKFRYNYSNYRSLGTVRRKELIALASLNTSFQDAMIETYVDILIQEVRVKTKIKLKNNGSTGSSEFLITFG